MDRFSEAFEKRATGRQNKAGPEMGIFERGIRTKRSFVGRRQSVSPAAYCRLAKNLPLQAVVSAARLTADCETA